MIIGYPLSMLDTVGYGDCFICKNAHWKKYKDSYCAQIPTGIYYNHHIKINVFYGKGLSMLHRLGYYPIYCKISSSGVNLTTEKECNFYDEIAPRILSLDKPSQSGSQDASQDAYTYLDSLDDDKIFNHSIWGFNNGVYNYYIHYRGYYKHYYKYKYIL